MSIRRKTAMVAIVAAVCMIGLASPGCEEGLAPQTRRSGSPDSPPASRLGEEWRQLLELPPDANPLLDNGDKCLSTGRKDKVLILWTTLEVLGDPTVCNVRPGTCSCTPPGRMCSGLSAVLRATEEEQRQCVLDFRQARRLDYCPSWSASTAGTPVNMGLESFLAISEQGTVELPDRHHPAGLEGAGDLRRRGVLGAGSASAPGSHTITVTIDGGVFAGTFRAVINVVPGLQS